MQATGLRVERLHRAARATDEQRAVHDRRRTEGDDVPGEAICPFELEPCDVGGAQARALGRLMARVVLRRPPARPARRRYARHDRRVLAAQRAGRRRGIVAGFTEERGHRLALVALHRIRDAHHQAEVESAQDSRR
jgi:hypothetical protein